MAQVLISGVAYDKILDPSRNDVEPWRQIVFDTAFQDVKGFAVDKDYYNGIVNDQEALRDLIRNSGINLTRPPGFAGVTQMMTWKELKINLNSIGASNPNLAITIPVALTPSLWKRTKTGAIQMWQGIGVATASYSDWIDIEKRLTTTYAGNGELVGQILDDPNYNVVMELIGFHGQKGSAKMQVKDPTQIVAKANRTTYRQLTNELNSK